VSTGKLLNGGLLYDLGDKSGNVEGPQVMNVKHYSRPRCLISYLCICTPNVVPKRGFIILLRNYAFKKAGTLNHVST